MADNVTTQIESKTRVSRHINLSSLYFIVGYLMFAYMLKDFIYSLFFVPYMIFSLCCAVYLVLPSRYNKAGSTGNPLWCCCGQTGPYTGPIRSRRWTMLDSMRQKLQKPARPRGVRGLQIFCIIFLLGNLLFLSTGIFMPKHYKDVEIAPIGTELELGEYTLTIASWDWAEKDRAFEIIFEVKDLSLNREPEYTFRFRCGDSSYRYKIYRIWATCWWCGSPVSPAALRRSP